MILATFSCSRANYFYLLLLLLLWLQAVKVLGHVTDRYTREACAALSQFKTQGNDGTVYVGYERAEDMESSSSASYLLQGNAIVNCGLEVNGMRYGTGITVSGSEDTRVGQLINAVQRVIGLQLLPKSGKYTVVYNCYNDDKLTDVFEENVPHDALLSAVEHKPLFMDIIVTCMEAAAEPIPLLKFDPDPDYLKSLIEQYEQWDMEGSLGITEWAAEPKPKKLKPRWRASEIELPIELVGVTSVEFGLSMEETYNKKYRLTVLMQLEQEKFKIIARGSPSPRDKFMEDIRKFVDFHKKKKPESESVSELQPKSMAELELGVGIAPPTYEEQQLENTAALMIQLRGQLKAVMSLYETLEREVL